MKTNILKNIPSLRNFIGGLLFGLLIVGLMSFTVGCSKSNDHGSAQAVGFGFGGDYGGAPSVGQFMANSNVGAQIALQFNSNTFAYGPVQTNGQFIVKNSGIYCPGAGAMIAPGVWNIDSTNQVQAEMDGDVVTDVLVTAYGPYNQALQIEIPHLNLTTYYDAEYLFGAGRSCSNISGFNEMYGTMTVRMNGYNCFTTYIDLATTTNLVCAP